ncbi:MAG: helix-turn-helix transcriptional regulator [Acidimicrobiia bacterium]|nr:helix-turn-helix transcriptional regulator [Acidimicrobiia bacterium]
MLDRLAGKWTVLVVYALIDGPKRHGSLRRMIQGISQKMLTQTLRRMEHDGLVKRHVIDRVPPHVEYTLTPLGMALTEPFAALCRWAMEHVAEIERSRAQVVDDIIAKHERELAAEPSA